MPPTHLSSDPEVLTPGRMVLAGKATGKRCPLCRRPILDSDIEQEVVVGPTTVFAHWDCYSIWRQEADAMARTPQHSVKTLTPLHIGRMEELSRPLLNLAERDS